MTIREIFDESVRACMDRKISEDAHLKVLDTEVVPRKLVEDAIIHFQARIVDVDMQLQYRMLQERVAELQGEKMAYRHCFNYLNELLNELEGEEE